MGEHADRINDDGEMHDLVYGEEQEMSTFKLIELHVAGLPYHTTREEVETFEEGEPLELIREPENPYDRYAVRVDRCGKKLGYVPKTHSEIIAKLFDHGYEVTAEVGSVIEPRQPFCTLVLLMPRQ